MLSGTRFSHYTPLAHVPRQQYLSDSIVYLMCASKIQVLTLQINFAAMHFTQCL